jgi:outer membrane protein TolC
MVGVQLSLPIYSGGKIKNETKRIEKQLEGIEYQKKGVENLIIQRINSAILKMVSEYSKIENAEKSVKAAEKSLDLVKDSYLRGVVSISDLIDAQTAFISAKRYEEAVVYQFLSALLETERASGKYYIIMGDEEKSQYLEEILN